MRPVPQPKDWLPCQPSGSFTGKAAQTLCYCWTGPDQGASPVARPKIWRDISDNTEPLQSASPDSRSPPISLQSCTAKKLGEFGLLLSTPDLFKLMSRDQEQKQNSDSCEQSSSHVIIIIFLSGTSKVLMYSRKTESRKAASACTHPHTEAPVMSLERPPQPTNPNIHNLPEVCAWERDLCGRTGYGELCCTLHSRGLRYLISRAKWSTDCSDLHGMIALYTITLLISLQQWYLHGIFSLHCPFWGFRAHNQNFFFSAPLHFIGLHNLKKMNTKPPNQPLLSFSCVSLEIFWILKLPCVSS